jgi:hypothetical protein
VPSMRIHRAEVDSGDPLGRGAGAGIEVGAGGDVGGIATLARRKRRPRLTVPPGHEHASATDR